MAQYTVVVDAMGGDDAPQCNVRGAVMAIQQDQNLKIILTGKQDVIREELEKVKKDGLSFDESRLEIRHTEQVIENEEHSPVEAVQQKKDSSLSVACRMVKQKEADGLVSAGNTGAVLAGGTLIVGRIRGIQRPALTLPLPTGNPPTVVLDVGANMDAKPNFLVQYARMATIYYREQYDVADPTVALLNVGVEEGKGNELTKEVYQILKEDPRVHFAGNIEAREVLNGAANIVVCDAFAGNVLLKTIEGTAKYVTKILKDGIKSSKRATVGALFLKPVLKDMKGKLDPTTVGGTPLLGVKGVVIKAHGNSNDVAIMNAIRQCTKTIQSNCNEKIAQSLKTE